MAKVKGPLTGIWGTGTFGKVITFQKTRTGFKIYRYTKQKDARTSAQLDLRADVKYVVEHWHLLTEEEKKQWDNFRPKPHVRGYHAFMSVNIPRKQDDRLLWKLPDGTLFENTVPPNAPTNLTVT